MPRIQDNRTASTTKRPRKPSRARQEKPAAAPAPVELARSIPHAVTRIFREQNRIHGRAVEPFGVSAEQAHLLLLLWTRGPLSMSELGKESALSSGTLSAATDRMVEAGLVRRTTDATDRRGVRVTAVDWPAGKRARLVATLLDAEEKMLAPLSGRERRTLWALLERVADGLGERARKG